MQNCGRFNAVASTEWLWAGCNHAVRLAIGKAVCKRATSSAINVHENWRKQLLRFCLLLLHLAFDKQREHGPVTVPQWRYEQVSLDAAVFSGCLPQCYELFKGGEPLDSSFLHKLAAKLQPGGRTWDTRGIWEWDSSVWQCSHTWWVLYRQAWHLLFHSFSFVSFLRQAEWVTQKSPGPAPAYAYLCVRPNLHVTTHTHTAGRK